MPRKRPRKAKAQSKKSRKPAPLLTQYAKGVPGAADRLAEQYAPLFVMFAKRAVATGADVEDAAQDLWQHVLARARLYDAARGRETTFIGLVAANRRANSSKVQVRLRAIRELDRDLDHDLDESLDLDSSDDRQQRYDDADELKAVLKYLNGLPQPASSIAKAVMLRGLTVRTVARLHSLSQRRIEAILSAVREEIWVRFRG